MDIKSNSNSRERGQDGQATRDGLNPTGAIIQCEFERILPCPLS